MRAQAQRKMGVDLVRNGVTVSALIDTIRAVLETPELAEFKFRAANRWHTGGHNETVIRGFYGQCREIERDEPFNLHADEPPVLLGEDMGANPVEYVLTALASCMTTSMVYHAAGQGINIESLSSSIEGDIDLNGFLDLNPNVRKGYREIRLRFKVKSDADAAKLEELAKKSPVFDIVTNPTAVKVEIVKE
jgi:uncharacterized OsmC-like protein